MLLQENRADKRQIEAALKTLSVHHTECESQITTYFDTLCARLKQQRHAVMDALGRVKQRKGERLQLKLRGVQRTCGHILRQKALCDELLNAQNDGDDDELHRQQRQERLIKLKDSALTKPKTPTLDLSNGHTES